MKNTIDHAHVITYDVYGWNECDISYLMSIEALNM